MPARKKEKKPRKKPELPAGLDEAALDVRFALGDIDMSRIRKWPKQFTAFYESNAGRVYGYLSSDRTFPNAHGHVSVRALSKAQQVEFRLELVPGREKPRGPNHPGLSEFLAAVRDVIHDPDVPRVGVATGTFNFRSPEWQPTIKLPFAPPGPLDVPGLPQIAGVDFAFTSSGPEQPYLRAFVSTYDPLPQFIVRIMLGFSAAVDADLPERLVSFVGEKVLVFAHRPSATSDAP